MFVYTYTCTWKALDLVTSAQTRAFSPGYCSFLFTLAILIFLISTTVGNVCSEIPFRTLSEHPNAPQQTIFLSACVEVAFERCFQCFVYSVTTYALAALGTKMAAIKHVTRLIQSRRSARRQADFKGCPHFPSNTLVRTIHCMTKVVRL